jgi:hypothetical protein
MNRKSIEGYEGLYEVDTEGNIYSLNFSNTGKIKKLKPRLAPRSSYYSVNLYKDKKVKTHYIHRLVAEAFIPNPENKPQVDHENKIRTDNRIENLRWLTHQQNCFNTSAKGCYHDKRYGKWRAYICVDGKSIYLGSFDTEEEAHASYLKAKEELHIIA